MKSEYLRFENNISMYYNVNENIEYDEILDYQISRLNLSVKEIINYKNKNDIALEDDEIYFENINSIFEIDYQKEIEFESKHFSFLKINLKKDYFHLKK